MSWLDVVTCGCPVRAQLSVIVTRDQMCRQASREVVPETYTQSDDDALKEVTPNAAMNPILELRLMRSQEEP